MALLRRRAGLTLLFGVTLWGLTLFIHMVNAFAIITRAAAVAIAYVMREGKAFAKVPAFPLDHVRPSAKFDSDSFRLPGRQPVAPTP